MHGSSDGYQSLTGCVASKRARSRSSIVSLGSIVLTVKSRKSGNNCPQFLSAHAWLSVGRQKKSWGFSQVAGRHRYQDIKYQCQLYLGKRTHMKRACMPGMIRQCLQAIAECKTRGGGLLDIEMLEVGCTPQEETHFVCLNVFEACHVHIHINPLF